MKKLLTLLAFIPIIAHSGFFGDLSSEFTQIFNPSEIVVKDVVENEMITTPSFELSELELLPAETHVINAEYLKDHYQEVTLILKSFEGLERNLRGYEEKRVVTELKNFFRDKYLINQSDLIQIKKNLNEVLN